MRPYYSEGGITIYHGDCREVLPTLPDADLLLTDPPYAVSKAGVSVAVGNGTRNYDFFPMDYDWDACRAMVVEALTLALPKAPSAYVWCGHRQFGDVVALAESIGLSTRPVVWKKSCPIPAPPGSGFASAVELCVYAYRKGRTWNDKSGMTPNVIESDSYRYGQPGKVDHPTQKPTRLIQPLVLISTPDDGLVIDCFVGSGTTLDVCKATGRRAIGIEIEERYCEIAARRLRQGVLDFSQ